MIRERHAIYPATEPAKAYYFYTSQTALEIYVLVALTIATRCVFVLYGIPMVVFCQITKIVLRWSMYILGDLETRDVLSMSWGFVVGMVNMFRRIVASKSAFHILITCSFIPRNLLGFGYRRFIFMYVVNSIYSDLMLKKDEWKRYRLRRTKSKMLVNE
jgi:hypothetical protein